MPKPDDQDIELTPTEARGGRRGTTVFVILAISTLLAVAVMALFWVGTAAA